MDDAYVRSTHDALRHFGVTQEVGLSAKAVTAARETHGRNGTKWKRGTTP